MEIRTALESDAAGISELIQLVSVQCNFSETEPCPQWFIDSTKPDVLQPLIVSDDYLWLIAVERGEVTGVLTLFEGNLVKYLFVHPKFQRKGVARALWQRAIPNCVQKSAYGLHSLPSLFMRKGDLKKSGRSNFLTAYHSNNNSSALN